MQKVIFNRFSLLGCLLLICNSSFFSQDFTWIKGTSLVGQSGAYGNMGVSTSTNSPGGREGAVNWTDANGNFWMFGGVGFDFIGNYGPLNDLWKYNISSNQWTWIKGDDIISQLGLYGTMGVSSPTNKPGSRSSSVSWIDASGNLWLFGGMGTGATSGLGSLNDLWKFDPVTTEWVWVSGGNAVYQPGNYGTQGVPAPGNIPGTRYGSSAWYDNAGSLWLFGGIGNTTNSLTVATLDDLWKYSISTNEWTWVKGSSTGDQNGIYGTQGTAALSNNPGSRNNATALKDGSGNFWLFGGEGWDAVATVSGLLSDLWKYNPTSNEWTWIKGNNTINQNGVYGLQGIVNPSNMPGGRSGAEAWIDAVGNMWLFGGDGYPATGTVAGSLNDLWKYTSTTNEFTWIRGSSVIDQHGNYGTQGVPVFTNIPGGRSRYVNWIDASNNLWFFGGYGQPATGNAGNMNDLWKYTNCFISPITMTITSQDSVICAGESTSLTVTGSTNYLWSSNLSTASFIVIQPNANTTYSVFTSDNNGCKYSSAFTQTVLACSALENLSSENLEPGMYPNPGNGTFYLNSSTPENNSVVQIFNSLGQRVFDQVLTQGNNQLNTQLAKGIYYYQVNSSNTNKSSGKLIVE